MECNKKSMQLFAALWIMIFHLWIPLSNTTAGTYLIKIGYLGVDIFFFLAAYSLADKEINYGSFLKNRFLNIYLRFVFFVIVAAIYGSWKYQRIIKVLTGIEFFQRGGGSFLWYIPAVMILYIVYPLLLKCKWKYWPAVALAVWLGLSILSQKAFGYTDIFIFTNRIPVILAGYIFKKYKIKSFVPAVCLPLGFIILYFYGFTKKLNIPIKDFYFVLGVLAVIGIIFISSFIPKIKIIDILGAASFEMYALQMIFGPKLVTAVYRATSIKWATNLIVFSIMIIASVMLSQTYSLLNKKIQKR